MFEVQPPDYDRPLLFCLHYLGGSRREWAPVGALLERLRCEGLDLPGFGMAAAVEGYTVEEMAATIAREIHLRAPRRWMIAGHSMGAKVAAVLARRAEDGATGLAGLEGIILVAGSPPGPEPMDEAQRQAMLGWFDGDAFSNRTDAQRYVDANISANLGLKLNDSAVSDVLRANRAAWRAWLEAGSREDWTDRVGVLQTPALIVAGANDANLGPAAQRVKMVPHFANARLITIAGAKHLLPLERPQELARSIDDHAAAVVRHREHLTAASNAYRDLIASNRVGEKTRAVLRVRERPDDADYAPAAMDRGAFAALRAVLDRVVPQTGTGRIDLAARIDTELVLGPGDGWRFAELPPDAQAYRAALLTLNEAARQAYGHDFAALQGAGQDQLLTRIAGDGLQLADAAADSSAALNAAQMRRWFADVCADAVKHYLGHPQTLARIGYSGIANGGDGRPKSGFARVGLAEREAWEPVAAAEFNI